MAMPELEAARLEGWIYAPKKGTLCALMTCVSALKSPDTRRLPRAAPTFKLRRRKKSPFPKQEQQTQYMVATDRVSEIFADARAVHADALRLLAAGDIRDAAEKAWCATKRATDALILARTGVETEISSDTARGLARLSTEDHAVRPLRRRYFIRQSHLHGTCFYLGLFANPWTKQKGRIRRTADYIIDKAENLAGVN